MIVFCIYSQLPLLRTPSGEDLVSVIARVRNSRVREKKNCFRFKLSCKIICKSPRSNVVSTIFYFFIYNYGPDMKIMKR